MTSVFATALAACLVFGRPPLEVHLEAHLRDREPLLKAILGIPPSATLQKRRESRGVDLVWADSDGVVIAIAEIKVHAAENYSHGGPQSQLYRQQHPAAAAYLLCYDTPQTTQLPFLHAGWQIMDLKGLGFPLGDEGFTAAAFLHVAGRSRMAQQRFTSALKGQFACSTVTVDWRRQPERRVSTWVEISRGDGSPSVLIGYDSRIKAVGISTPVAAYTTRTLEDDPVGRSDLWDGQIDTQAAWSWKPETRHHTCTGAAHEIAKMVQSIHAA